MATSIYLTFIASLRSVGTACTMAGVGVYLHRRNFIVGEGKRTLALISQQVTIPAFLFTKIVYCNQDWSDEPCPDVTESLGDVWMLLLWPAYVVGCGIFIGLAVSRLAKTPRHQVRSVLAACAFGNSTGLPITLLTVIHANFPTTTELGRIDPTLFLSVYLLLYPVLQWGIGGWLLAPEEEEAAYERIEDDEDSLESGTTKDAPPTPKETISQRKSLRASRKSFKTNVLNNKNIGAWYKHSHRGIHETDASLYISNSDLVLLAAEEEKKEGDGAVSILLPDDPTLNTAGGSAATEFSPIENGHPLSERTPLGSSFHRDFSTKSLEREYSTKSIETSTFEEENVTCCETLSRIASRCLQPPVVGCILGLIVAATPLRGIFVDLVDRADSAPLEWLFDGLYAVGQAAVPLNMMILGCNLSASSLTKAGGPNLLSNKTMAAIVVGKMIIMPFIGIASAVFLERFVWDIPDDIDAAFYLVAMIVFITPTANNVMVMVELSGSGTKEGIARVIGWQYAVAPVILSLTVTAVVGVASKW